MKKCLGVLLIGVSVLMMGFGIWSVQSCPTVVADLSRGIQTPAPPVAKQTQTPNDSWWAARWFAMQKDKSIETSVKKPLLGSKGLVGYVAMDAENQWIEVICTGGTGEGKIRLQNFQDTVISSLSKVRIAVESVHFSGTQTVIVNPTMRQLYLAETDQKELVITLPDMKAEETYHIVIAPTGTEQIEAFDGLQTVRYEAEKGTILGAATVVERETATSAKGFVGAISAKDAGVQIKVKAPKNGTYRLDLLFQNEAQGTTPNETFLVFDGEKIGKLTCPVFTEKVESGILSLELELEQGRHTIAVQQTIDEKTCTGAVALDCVDMTYLYGQQEEPPVVSYYAVAHKEQTSSTKSSFTLIAPADGYYSLTFFCAVSIGENATFFVDGEPINQISLNTKSDPTSIAKLSSGVHQIVVVHDGLNQITSISFSPTSQMHADN